MNTGRINKVVDYTFKSYKKYTGPDDEFDRTNIFFAPNGQGKSALAIGIKDEYLKNNTEDNLRLYNIDYVETRLRVDENSGNIRGVKLNFGDNADIEQQLAELEKKRGELSKSIATIHTDNTELIDTTEAVLSDIFARRKGKTKIQKKTHRDGLHEKVISLWIDEYKETLKLFPTEDYVNITGNDDFSKNLDAINGINLPNIANISDEDYKEIERILGVAYGTEDMPSPAVVKWLGSGLQIHYGKQTCEFCLSKLDIKEVATRIEKYTDDIQSVDSKKLETMIETIGAVIGQITIFVANRQIILSALDNGTDASMAFDDIETQLDVLRLSVGALSDKLDQMDKQIIDVVPDMKSAVRYIETNISDLNVVKSNLKKDYEKRINRLEQLVKGSIGYEVSTNALVKSNADTYGTNLEKLETLNTQANEVLKAVNELKESKSDLASFAKYLNEILDDINIGFNLRLDKTDKSYFIENNVTHEKLHIRDISEGERNFLALIYFYYEMLSDDGESLRDDIRIVIIDDPISSVDDENRFYILELIKRVIDDKGFQSFIFTHAWHDFFDLCYGKNDDHNVKKYEIHKTDGCYSDVYPAKSVVAPYKRLFKEIFDFSMKKYEDIQPTEVLHTPNTMRRILEEYMRFNHSIPFATQASYNKIARALMRQEVAKITPKNETKIKTMLSVCNVLSHGTPRAQSARDIHNSAKFLMSRFKVIDQYHFDEMSR